jgi:hypothetical protein
MKRIQLALLIACAVAMAGNVFAQGGKSFVINHFVSDPNVIQAHLVITDVDGKGPQVSMKFYNNDGKLVGEGKEIIQPFGKLNLNPGKYVNNAVVNGTVHITANGNIVAEYWQFYKKSNETWKNTTAIGYSTPGFSKMVCPHFVSDKSVEAYLVLANSDGKDATVDIKFYDDSGRELGKAHELVKANGKAILKPMDYVKTQATGVAHIVASGGKVTGEYWQAEQAKQYQTVVPMGGL